jgi:hypothetical protein
MRSPVAGPGHPDVREMFGHFRPRRRAMTTTGGAARAIFTKPRRPPHRAPGLRREAARSPPAGRPSPRARLVAPSASSVSRGRWESTHPSPHSPPEPCLAIGRGGSRRSASNPRRRGRRRRSRSRARRASRRGRSRRAASRELSLLRGPQGAAPQLYPSSVAAAGALETRHRRRHTVGLQERFERLDAPVVVRFERHAGALASACKVWLIDQGITGLWFPSKFDSSLTLGDTERVHGPPEGRPGCPPAGPLVVPVGC